MKYCIVYGGPHEKNTYYAVQIVKKRLAVLGPMEFTEFYLPQDFPKFCTGCYTCFMKGEEKHPHREYAGPIESAILKADGLIFASPVYVMEIMVPMKNMLDYFGYLFMAHRPHREMFRKSALIVPITADAGTKYAISNIVRSPSCWRISRILRCGATLWSEGFDDMKESRRIRTEHSPVRSAKRLYESLKKGSSTSIRTKRMFSIMKQAVFKFADNPADRTYWAEQGWAQGEKPWNQTKGKQE